MKSQKAVELKGRSLLTLKDLSYSEIRYLLDLSHRCKEETRGKTLKRRFEGKTLAMLFEKRSTRTRCAFETAFGEEGGHPAFLSSADIHLGAKETLEDTARVLGRMFDAIQFRGFSQTTVELLARYSGIPVFNGLTDSYHPSQILADLMTIEEAFGSLSGRKIVYLGDGRNNVARSLMIGCLKMNVGLWIACPESLEPDLEILNICSEIDTNYREIIHIVGDLAQAVDGADAVYTDVWVSMGEESQEAERLALLSPYRVTSDVMKMTGKQDSIFLHCLPAVRGNEVSPEVMDGPQSLIWEEAENRKHTIKSVMLAALGLD